MIADGDYGIREFVLRIREVTKLSPLATDPHPSSMMEVPAHVMSVLTWSAPIPMHVPPVSTRDHPMSLRIVLLHVLRHHGNGQG